MAARDRFALLCVRGETCSLASPSRWQCVKMRRVDEIEGKRGREGSAGAPAAHRRTTGSRIKGSGLHLAIAPHWPAAGAQAQAQTRACTSASRNKHKPRQGTRKAVIEGENGNEVKERGQDKRSSYWDSTWCATHMTTRRDVDDSIWRTTARRWKRDEQVKRWMVG